jgi:hypothetical protein
MKKKVKLEDVHWVCGRRTGKYGLTKRGAD